jgi:putative intracellular protease/amidase
MGYLDGKRYTCFPGFQQGKGIYENTGSVIDGNLVTGHSMAYSIPFAENLVCVLVGESGVERLKGGAYGI